MRRYGQTPAFFCFLFLSPTCCYLPRVFVSVSLQLMRGGNGVQQKVYRPLGIQGDCCAALFVCHCGFKLDCCDV